MKRLLIAALCAATALSMAGAATATVISFDEPTSGPVYSLFNPSYSEAGLTFSTTYQTGVWKPGPGQGADNGTQYLINGYNPLTITKTGGGDFRFNGFDFAQGLYSSNATDPLVVTLNLAGGGSTIIHKTSTGIFQTLHAGTMLVSSVVVGGTSGYLGLDNVTFGLVPEPASWALMIGGFGLVGAMARRRRSAFA
jgi:hypothetical protein